MTCDVVIQCTGEVEPSELRRRLTMPGFLAVERVGERTYRAQFNSDNSANAVVFSLNGTKSHDGHYFQARVAEAAPQSRDMWGDLDAHDTAGSHSSSRAAGDWKEFLKTDRENLGFSGSAVVEPSSVAPSTKRRKVDTKAVVPEWLLHIPPKPELHSPKTHIPAALDMRALRELSSGAQCFYIRMPTGAFAPKPRPLNESSAEVEVSAPSKKPMTCIGLSWAGEKPKFALLKKAVAKKAAMLTFEVRVTRRVAAMVFGTEAHAQAVHAVVAEKFPQVNPMYLSEDMMKTYLEGSV